MRVSYAIPVLLPVGVSVAAVTRASPASNFRDVNVPDGLCVFRIIDSIETPPPPTAKSLACTGIGAGSAMACDGDAMHVPSTKYSKPVAVQSIRKSCGTQCASTRRDHEVDVQRRPRRRRTCARTALPPPSRPGAEHRPRRRVEVGREADVAERLIAERRRGTRASCPDRRSRRLFEPACRRRATAPPATVAAPPARPRRRRPARGQCRARRTAPRVCARAPPRPRRRSHGRRCSPASPARSRPRCRPSCVTVAALAVAAPDAPTAAATHAAMTVLFAVALLNIPVLLCSCFPSS